MVDTKTPLFSWQALMWHIERILNISNDADREDLRQSILLTLLEKHAASGIALFPGFHFIAKCAHFKRLSYLKRKPRRFVELSDLISEETMACAYGFCAEDVIDIVRELRADPRFSKARHSNCGRYNDLTGQVFGDWKVVDLAPPGPHKGKQWWVQCTHCGRRKIVLANSLKSGTSRFCNNTRSAAFEESAKRNLVIANEKRRAKRGAK